MQTAKAGNLTVRIVDESGGKPKLLVVLCHGYGAPGSDLVGIAQEVMSLSPQLKAARFVFPEAPLEVPMSFGGRAWWHIDIGRFVAAIEQGTVDELMDDTPEGMPHARKLLLAALDELRIDAPMVLSGFSQGSMLATDVTLRLDEPPAALAVFSGTLLCRPEWTRLAPKRKGLDVVQSHGSMDPILPYGVALELRKLFDESGLRVRFHEFRGGHGIDGETIQMFAQLCEEKLA